MKTSSPMTGADLSAIERGIDAGDLTHGQVHQLIAEVRRQRSVLDQVDAATNRIDSSLDAMLIHAAVKPVAPSAVLRRIESLRHVAMQIANGLEGQPFQWGAGQREAWTPLAKQLGLTLVTRSHADRLGYAIKRGAKPVGSAYFRAPLKRTAQLYVLECQCVKQK